MGLSLDTPINFDVLLINTFIRQLPVVFWEHGRISLAGVLERRFVISITTFELWLRETIVVFLGMICGTDRCFVNTTLYSHAVFFQRAVFKFITAAGTWWGDGLFFRLQETYGYDYWWLIPCLEHSNMTLSQYFHWKSCEMDVQHGNVGQEVRENVYQYKWWRFCQMEGWTIWCFSSVGVSVLHSDIIAIVKVQCK